MAVVSAVYYLMKWSNNIISKPISEYTYRKKEPFLLQYFPISILAIKRLLRIKESLYIFAQVNSEEKCFSFALSF